MIKTLNNDVSYVEGDDAFLCPNLYFVNGASASLLVDVTNVPSHLAEALASIKDMPQNPRQIYVALTHFHDDHIAAIRGLPKEAIILSSKNTARYLPQDLPNEIRIVSSDLDVYLGDGSFAIMPVPSLHSKGSLDVLVGDTLFTGDSLGSRESKDGLYYNHEIAVEMEKRYKEIPFSLAVQAHPGAPSLSKEKLMGYLHELVEQGFSKSLIEGYI